MPRAQRPDKHRGPEVNTIARVERGRAPTTADLRRPETNVNYELNTIWLDTSSDEPWILVKKENNLATWVRFSGAEGDVISLTGDDSDVIEADGDGNIDVFGKTVANATRTKPVWTEGTIASNLIEVEVQVATEVTGAPGDKNDAGICSFDDSQFKVDSDGYVELVGGDDDPVLQTITGDDAEAVGPDAAGNIDWQGSTVVNASNAKPLYFNGTPGSNLMEPEIQVSTALSAPPSDKNDSGLASFDSANFTVSSHGFIQLKGAVQKGFTNLGISYSAGTFTVRGADSDLSATNPAYVTFQSKATPGELVTIAVTSNQTFIDDAGASTIIGSRFGVASGSAWDEDAPFFLYAVSNDNADAVAFMISRNPNVPITPVAAGIGKTGSIVNVGQFDFFSLGNPTVADYAENPTVPVGSFRMQMSASDDWTVQTLSNRDGIDQFHSETQFAMPTGQNGSAAGTYIIATAGTEPIWTTNGMYYHVFRDGHIRYLFNGQNASTAGVGANTLRPVLPYSPTGQESFFGGVFIDSSDSDKRYLNVSNVLAGSTGVNATYGDQATAAYTLALIASGDHLQITFFYRAYAYA